jgi:hypothetical protein
MIGVAWFLWRPFSLREDGICCLGSLNTFRRTAHAVLFACVAFGSSGAMIDSGTVGSTSWGGGFRDVPEIFSRESTATYGQSV